MQQRKNILTLCLTILVMACVTALSACSDKSNAFEFQNTAEAVSACRQVLSDLRGMKEPSIESLAKKAARWVALQDTTFSLMMRDSTIDSNSAIAIDFFMVSDSIRTEIERAVMEKKRTMKDILYLKIHTARDREKTLASEDFKAAKKFYEEADKQPTFKDLQTTISEYKKLLKESNFKKEQQMLEFIKKEDRCFRSLMLFLPQVTQEQLEIITQETATLFDNLYRNASADPENAVNSRIMMYLSMRFNRRIVQNAMAVQRDIEKEVRLTEKQTANYRWMIIQPFLSIDNYAMATITEEQEECLNGIAEKLPRTLSSLDGKDYDKSSKEETEKLTSVLTEYFVRAYIKQSL